MWLKTGGHSLRGAHLIRHIDVTIDGDFYPTTNENFKHLSKTYKNLQEATLEPPPVPTPVASPVQEHRLHRLG